MYLADVSKSGAPVSTPQSAASLKAPSTTSLRTLPFNHPTVACSIRVPHTLWGPATHLRDEFIAAAFPESDHDDKPSISTSVELLAHFQSFLVEHAQQSPDDYWQEASDRVLVLVIDSLESELLKGQDVHTVVAALDIDYHAKLSIIQAYISALHYLGRPYPRPLSAPLSAVANRAVSVYTVFGGQGNDEKYFNELREVFTTYRPLVEDLIISAAQILQQKAADSRFSENYSLGMDLLQWLKNHSTQPNDSYLISAPVSFPLIALLQLAHYQIVCKLLGCDPRDMHSMWSGASGHSQGIVVSVIVSISTDWATFHARALEGLEILQSIGARSQEHFAMASLPPSIIENAEAHGEGSPTPMLSVRDLTREEIDPLIYQTNKHLPLTARIGISIVNGPQNFVITGLPLSLHGFNSQIRMIKALPGVSQDRVPFSQRRPTVSNRFLPISAPFHSLYLSEVAGAVDADVRGITITGTDLCIPVFATDDGRDLTLEGHANLVPALVRMITESPQEWTVATQFPNATHVVDFGPGGASGAGSLINHNKRGTGVKIILASILGGVNSTFGYKSDLLGQSGTESEQQWTSRYSPRLVQNTTGTFVDTKMTRLLGLPPVMVAGMTPTTVSWRFVTAVMNAGYHVELAFGGYHNSEVLTAAIRNIAAEIDPGRGITCNVIYANPTAVKWQIPLLAQLIAEGLPIDGLTFGAGVPSLDIASQYIAELGLKHIGFKPGSLEAIYKVIEIARANPTFPIILQWTGGRSGGHHSFESFHKPLVQTYAAIRRCENIVLIAGSGFGGSEDSYPYLTGEWSKGLSIPAMPFDGILLGSRVMVAKEAKTSLAVKQAIVAAQGVDDDEWERTYEGSAGGVITVMSEMGQPIHKLATRGVMLWSELEKTVFSLEKSKRVAALQKRREYIIQRLNDDFQKVWFGRNLQTGQAIDIEDMTYAGVIQRLVQLMYVGHEMRWIDESYKTLVLDFIVRAEARIVRDTAYASSINSVHDLNEPYFSVQALLRALPELEHRLLSFQDVQYFISLCRKKGQKPVPFMLALDEQFEVLFKKDSLWQSEDLEAVVDQDMGRVCVLQGPVAVRHSTVVNEPVKDILDGIHTGHAANLLAQLYGNSKARIPFVECFGSAEQAGLKKLPDWVLFSYHESDLVYEITRDADAYSPAADEWLNFLAGTRADWRWALFTTRKIVRDRKVTDNPIWRLFAPRSETLVRISGSDTGDNQVISLYERRAGVSEPFKVVQASVSNGRVITLSLMDERNIQHKPLSLDLQFRYSPETSYAPLHDITSDRIDCVRSFYYTLWFGDMMDSPLHVRDEFVGAYTTITKAAIVRFAQSIENLNGASARCLGKRLQAPMDFVVVVAWKPLMMPLFAAEVQGDLSNLVHLSNEFRMVAGCLPIREGDILQARCRVTAVVNQAAGKMIEVSGHILRDELPTMELTSQFLILGTYEDHQDCFQVVENPPTVVHLKTENEVQILKTKKWLSLDSAAPPLLGSKIVFQSQTTSKFNDGGILTSAITTGFVSIHRWPLETVTVGAIHHTGVIPLQNAVVCYLERYGVPLTARTTFGAPLPLLEEGDSVIRFPTSNEQYARASGDYNPIHVSKTLSAYVGLPGTITHGMHTSASVRSVVERCICPSDAGSFRSWKCSFVGMVLPNDEISVVINHTGMIEGRKIIQVTALNHMTKSTVLNAEAEIEHPKTAFVFTGQGSQEKNMGMDLYETSRAARDVWDRADSHFWSTFGKAL